MAASFQILERGGKFLPPVRVCSVTSDSSEQSPLFMGFSKKEPWSELPFLLPGDLPDLRVGPKSLLFPALAGVLFTTAPPGSLITPQGSMLSPHCLMLVSTMESSTAVVSYLMVSHSRCVSESLGLNTFRYSDHTSDLLN